jgi:hypothetical protein
MLVNHDLLVKLILILSKNCGLKNKRELKGEEYYFIAIDENNEEFATYRLYNKTKESIEIGSFVSNQNMIILSMSLKWIYF